MARSPCKFETLGPFANGEGEPRRNKARFPTGHGTLLPHTETELREFNGKPCLGSLLHGTSPRGLFSPHDFPLHAAVSFIHLDLREKIVITSLT